MTGSQLTLLPDTLEVRFQRWIRENPQVVEAVRQAALDWYRAGHARCGIGMLCEHVRWQTGVATGSDGFKVNNSYRSRLARLIVATTPELPPDFFEFRALTSQEDL